MGNKSHGGKFTRASPKGKITRVSSKDQSIGFSAKGKSAGASLKKGKEKGTESDHKSQKKKITSRERSPSNVNFKKARYDCPDHFGDSDGGNDTGFKDFPKLDLQ